MSTRPDDIGGRIWWVLSRYRWLSVVVIAAFIGAGYLKGYVGSLHQYEAATLVVATDLAIRADQLPRFAEAVFRGGSVARATADAVRGDVAAEDLIPEHIRLEPLEDNILLRVVGTDGDPDEAARYSHAAAVSLATELNRSGPGVGSFTIQERAKVPTRPVPTIAPAVPLVVSGVAGSMFVAAAAGLLLILRRPVTSAQQAATLTNLPLYGTPVVRRHRDPLRVAGLGVLLHQLFPSGEGRTMFIGVRGSQRSRLRLVELVVRALSRSRQVGYVSAEEGRDPILEEPDPAIVTVEPREIASAGPRMPVVIDAGSVEEEDVQQLVDMLPGGLRTALVIPEGTPEWRVVAAASQISHRFEAGVVFVPRSTRRAALPTRSSVRSDDTFEIEAAALSGPDDGPIEDQDRYVVVER